MLFCFFLRLGHPFDHLFYPPSVLAGFFMQKWAMCNKLSASARFFLRSYGIHLYGFLLIPRYNHDKIIGRIKQWCRKIGILHFPCGGYFFVLSINILSRNNAAACVERHELLYPCYHAGRVLFPRPVWWIGAGNQPNHLLFSIIEKAPEPSLPLG